MMTLEPQISNVHQGVQALGGYNPIFSSALYQLEDSKEMVKFKMRRVWGAHNQKLTYLVCKYLVDSGATRFIKFQQDENCIFFLYLSKEEEENLINVISSWGFDTIVRPL